MTNRERLNRASTDRFAAFLIRYTNCAVCVAKKNCPHYRRAPPQETAHQNDMNCKERLMIWLDEECIENGATRA